VALIEGVERHGLSAWRTIVQVRVPRGCGVLGLGFCGWKRVLVCAFSGDLSGGCGEIVQLYMLSYECGWCVG
jgi:hypothetical protein